MIQKVFASQPITAGQTPGVIKIPPGLDNAEEIALVVKHGYNANLTIAVDEAGARAVFIPDDTASPDNYTFFQGPVREAPIYCFADADTPITVMVFEIRS